MHTQKCRKHYLDLITLLISGGRRIQNHWVSRYETYNFTIGQKKYICLILRRYGLSEIQDQNRLSSFAYGNALASKPNP